MRSSAQWDTVITPEDRVPVLPVRVLWRARGLIWALAQRDLTVRYKHAALGALWALLQPTLLMVVFVTIFDNVRDRAGGGGVSYGVFVFAGLLPWTLCSQGLSTIGQSVVRAGALITKVYFPRLAIPIGGLLASLFDFVVGVALLVVMAAWSGVEPTRQLLWMPVVILLTATMAFALGVVVASLATLYQDVRLVLPFIVRVWLISTPVLYLDPSSPMLQGGKVASLVALNPITGVIGGFRASLFGSPMPWSHLAYSAAFAVLVLAMGLSLFARCEPQFTDAV